MQDELIIKYIKKKKEVGMELLIDNYRGILTSVVRKHLGVLINYEEECIDDVLLSIWDNIKSFDKNKNQFKNWICAIAKYKAIDYKRKYLAKVETLDMTDEIYYIDKDSKARNKRRSRRNIKSFKWKRPRVICKALFRGYRFRDYSIKE